jgi:TPR repeat protein
VEGGNPEAQRRVANDLRPGGTPGGAGEDSGHAAFWFRTACKQHYANAAVEFYEFAEAHRIRTGDPRHLDNALPCLQSAINQGHRGAIVVGAKRAESLEKNYERAFFLYSLMEKEDPAWADRRWELMDRLTLDAPDRLHRHAEEWRARNTIKSHDDFLREQSSARLAPTEDDSESIPHASNAN